VVGVFGISLKLYRDRHSARRGISRLLATECQPEEIHSANYLSINK
jgi:hypothetical protein